MNDEPMCYLDTWVFVRHLVYSLLKYIEAWDYVWVTEGCEFDFA